MSLYGEYANLEILRYYDDGITVEKCGSPAGGFEAFDMIYMGAGTEKASMKALELLMPYKKELKNYVENGGIMLLTGSAGEIFGGKIEDNGKENDGLGVFGYSVRRTDKRILGDAFADDTNGFFGENARTIGFINRCGIYSTAGNLFTVRDGLGSDLGCGEGFAYGNAAVTSLIGPLLVKNPHICRYYLKKLGCDVPSDMTVQQKAYGNAVEAMSADRK